MTHLLTLKNIGISFGKEPIFSDVTATIHAKDRIGLIGRNGAGKSTLMHIIHGDHIPDNGDYILSPGASIGFLTQQLPENTTETIYGYLAIEKDQYYKADTLLQPLQLDGTDKMDQLSGGQRRRVGLISALIHEPDILLLDEPTNHLDIDAILWLEQFLQHYSAAVIIISHDRQFLRNVTRKSWLLFQKTLFKHHKGFKDFGPWYQAILEQEEKRLHKQSKTLTREESWLTHGVSARRKRNIQRLTKLQDLRSKAKGEQSLFVQQHAKMALPDLPKNYKSQLIVECEHMGKSFDGKQLFQQITLRIMKQDRIAIIGPNGAGKTTLIEILLGLQKPDTGTIRFGAAFHKIDPISSYFDQYKSCLDPTLNLMENLCPHGGDQIELGNGKQRHVIGYLKDFLFDPKEVHVKASTLSGGQAHRLMLAKVLANPGPLLVLDEPTNDLDMDGMDQLEDYVGNYKGTALIISHDRDFIDQIATKTLSLDGNGNVDITIGGYRDLPKQAKQPSPKKRKKITSPKKETNRQKLSPKEIHLLKTLPDTLETLATSIAALEQRLKDPVIFTDTPDRAHQLLEQLKSLMEERKTKEELYLSLLLKEEEIHPPSDKK